MDKFKLRKLFREQRQNISLENRRQWDRCIRESFLNHELYKQTDTVLCYASFGTETDTFGMMSRILADGKHLACPKVINRETMIFYEIEFLSDLSSGYYGIMEPAKHCLENPYDTERLKNECHLPLVIIPALAYDNDGYRLGYGGGFYDRWLEKYSQWVKSIGVSYACQHIDHLPYAYFDIPVDALLTERGFVSLSDNRKIEDDSE